MVLMRFAVKSDVLVFTLTNTWFQVSGLFISIQIRQYNIKENYLSELNNSMGRSQTRSLIPALIFADKDWGPV